MGSSCPLRSRCVRWGWRQKKNKANKLDHSCSHNNNSSSGLSSNNPITQLDGQKTSSGAVRMKILLSKAEAMRLLVAASVSVDTKEVMQHLDDLGRGSRSSGGSWRPTLESIPEIL